MEMLKVNDSSSMITGSVGRGLNGIWNRVDVVDGVVVVVVVDCDGC